MLNIALFSQNYEGIKIQNLSYNQLVFLEKNPASSLGACATHKYIKHWNQWSSPTIKC